MLSVIQARMLHHNVNTCFINIKIKYYNVEDTNEFHEDRILRPFTFPMTSIVNMLNS